MPSTVEAIFLHSVLALTEERNTLVLISNADACFGLICDGWMINFPDQQHQNLGEYMSARMDGVSRFLFLSRGVMRVRGANERGKRLCRMPLTYADT